MRALVVLSGGQDSTIALFWAKKYYSEVLAITFNYGQKHIREIESARKIAGLAQVYCYQELDISNILKSRSPLTNPNEQLEQYDNYEHMNSIIGNRLEHTFVPMRNSTFLTIATNYALYNDCYVLVTGVCKDDEANYPDCKKEFIESQIQTINYSLGIDYFTIETPLINLKKSESIKLAQSLNGCMEALAYSHTSYDGQYPPLGRDHATILREQGFLEANIPDPLVMRAWKEGLMDLPKTENYKEYYENK